MRIDQPARHDQLGRVVDADIHHHKILGRHEKQHPAGERRQSDKDRRHIVAQRGKVIGQLSLWPGGQEPERPGAGAWEFDQNHLVEAFLFFIEEGFGDLLDRAVDGPDHGHPVNQNLAPADDGPADQALGQPADDDGDKQKHQNADAAHRKFILRPKPAPDQRVRLVGGGNERQDPAVKPADEGPDEVDRQPDGQNDNKARQKAGAQSGQKAAAR